MPAHLPACLPPALPAPLQALTELHYDMPGTVLVRLLPAPHHAYPNLEQLEANISADTADPQAWVAALAQLPRLRSLRLRRLAGWGGLTAPSGAALTELVLAAQGGVEVGLRGLPALRRLCIHSDAAPFLAHGGTVKVRIEEELASATASGDGASGGRSGTAAGGSCSSGLRELKVWCAGELDLDFGLLPQLEQLSLTVGSLSDAASAGTCTALSRLWLSGSPTVARQLMEALPRPEVGCGQPCRGSCSPCSAVRSACRLACNPVMRLGTSRLWAWA